MQREIFAISPNQSPQKKMSLWFDEDTLSSQCQALQPSNSQRYTHTCSAGHMHLGQQTRNSPGAFLHPAAANSPSLGFLLGSRSRIYSTKEQLKKHTGSNPPITQSLPHGLQLVQTDGISEMHPTSLPLP